MSELTNLLSRDRIRALRREYMVRLLTVAAVLTSIVVGVHAVLLSPAYIYLLEEVKTREAHLAGLALAFASSEGQEMGTRLAELGTRAEALYLIAKAPTGSSVIRSVLATPHSGIRITGVTLSRPEGGGDSQMRVMGIAQKREPLQIFHKALSSLSFVSRADLPLSVYAQESDISFSITLSGTLAP